MSDSFDPYHVWLGIPPEEQPPDHYRLLGLRQFEEHRDVISHAAEQRMSHLRSMQAGPRSQDTQILLNQLAAARSCLMVPERKSVYDTKLREQSKIEPQLAYVPPMPLKELPEPRYRSPYRTDVAAPTVLLLIWGMAAGFLLIAGVALVLAWRFEGPVATEAKRDVQKSPVVEPRRGLPPIGRTDQSIKPPSPATVEPELPEPNVTEPTLTEPAPPPMASAQAVAPTIDRTVAVESPPEIKPKRDFFVRLDGVGDAIVLNNTANLFAFNNYFTVELWARFHPTPDPRSIVGNQVSLEDGSNAGWLLHMPMPAFRSRDNNRYITLNGAVRFGANLPEKQSDWQHFAVCGDRSSLLVFVDGSLVLIADGDSDLWPASDSNIMIGRNPLNKNYMMMGQNKLPYNIGDFRGDIRALRISSGRLYKDNFVPPPVFERREDDLVSLDFTIGDGDTLTDLSGNGHDGKIVSGEWVAIAESIPEAVQPSDVVVSGTTRDWMKKSFRHFSGPDAEEFASVYQKEGYRRLQDQVIVVNRPVVAPTVFLAQGVELFADVRANVAIVAQKVDLHGVVQGNLDIWAQVIHVKPDAIIKGDIRVKSAQSIRIEGRVEGIIIGKYGGIRLD